MSKMELGLAYMVLAKEYVMDIIKPKNKITKRVVNGKVVTIVDVKYRVV